MNVKAWIIPWYREQDWADWCSLFQFKGSHKEWLARAEAGARTQESLGYSVARVAIRPREFLEWSRANGGRNDGAARMACAIHLFGSREQLRAGAHPD